MPYYESPKINYNAPASEWEDSSDKTRFDLVRGLPYDIVPVVDPDGNFADEHYNTLASKGLLTNGVKATKITYCDPAVNRISGGGGRYIDFDLKHTSAVDGYAISFIYEKSTACVPTPFVKFYVSKNGTDWQLLDQSHPTVPTQVENDIVIHKVNFDSKYETRFVKIYFKVPLHVYIEEIEVYGCKCLEGANQIVGEPLKAASDIGYPDYSALCGVHNMALLYHCTPKSDGSAADLVPPSAIKPILGYYDKDGKLKDTFFDSILMLPRVNFEFSDYAFTKAGRSHYFDNLFTDGYNLSAVEQCASELSDELGKDVKVKIFLSIACPRKKVTDFGDVDGTGSLNFSKKEDRLKAVEWMVKEQYDRFKSKGYEHLELCGFYWFEEEVSSIDQDEVYLVGGARDAVHKHGLKLIWIPWFCSAGFDDWRDMGIDLACMQPNYVFSKGAQRDRLYKNAAVTKSLGMTVEIELHWEHTPDYLTKYLEYLEVGAETGYMNTPKIYYEMSGISAAKDATDPNYRSIYDATYLFAKEKLTVAKAQEFIKAIKW